MIYSVPAARPVLVLARPHRYHVNVQVLGAGAVRLAQSRWELETEIGGQKQGITLSSADGVRGLWWFGELWIIGEGGDASVNLQFA